ncbi:MAG: Phosphatidylglycerophosphate synthase [Roseibaca calidilacus]|uniref:Phosphatidylglycerophosphate synthase n=1 Tax=Roseibaca calidilacus TaxID=1666912 RepID=A0A0P7WHS3_9RHOB|nr:CDP-alcohol phosphatidyltransferase family protein [Roseibaca calidilacus]KPP93540.1 MAG: Phosphatidylglycerophosphate synthase [Roseibaca calidilacus]CUX80484.1 Phosphatidylglycerophosphate synthase [Roseibaca calidilacus]
MTRPDKPFGTTVAPQALRQAWVAVAAGLPLAAGGAFGLASHGGAEHAAVAALLAACMVLPAGVLVLRGFQRLAYPHARLGMCNIVTLMRGAVIAALAGLLAVPDALAVLGYPLAALAALVLALDGVDGWAARRAGLASHFGARLDVETDVAFALVMAALAVALDKVGPWFLLLGLLRPIFLLGGLVWPWLHGPLAPSQRRRFVAGLQMGGQVCLLLPVLSGALAQGLGLAILTVVLASFLYDIRSLHAQAERQP